jgi:ATP-dependent DNA ligase
VNGWRALIHVPTLTVYNRHGELLSITHEFKEALEQLGRLESWSIEWLDCEMLGRRHPLKKGHIIILDELHPSANYLERRKSLEQAEPSWQYMDIDRVELIESFSGDAPSDPLTLWEQLQEENHRYGCDYYEGLVAKRVTSTYETQLVSPSKTTTSWVKFRFDQYTEKT